MTQSLAIPRVIPNDWKRLDLIVNKIKMRLGSASSPTLTGLTITGLTASSLLQTDADKKLTSIALPLIVAKGGTGAATLTNHGILLGSGTGAITPLGAATHGQLPIGSTGADPVLATITGTASQVTVTNAAGSITLSLPQDYDAGATPTLGGLTLTGLTGILKATAGVISGSAGHEELGNLDFASAGHTGFQAQGDALDTIVALGAIADNEFIVGTGAGTYAHESGATARTSLGLVIGTNVLAQQPIGIANDNLVEIDDADAVNGDYTKFTANGLAGRSCKEVLDDLSGNYLSLTSGLWGEPYLRSPQLNNLFYSADKRFTITKTGNTISYNPAGLFNGDYEDQPMKIADGETVTLNINLIDKGEFVSYFLYSYGKIVVHFFTPRDTENIRARVKTKNAGGEYIWRDWVDSVDISRSTSYHIMSMSLQNNYYCREVEIEITASGNDVWLSEIEWNMDRDIDEHIFPLVQKYNPNSLYDTLYFKDSTNTQVAFITNEGNAYFGGNVGFGIALPKTRCTIAGTLTLKEQAAADADTEAYGQIWVKTASPNELWFTDDEGNHHQLAYV